MAKISFSVKTSWTLRLVRIYTVFFLIGTVVALVRYGFYQIPIVINVTLGSLNKVIEGSKNSQRQIFADGMIVLTIQVFAVVILIYTL